MILLAFFLAAAACAEPAQPHPVAKLTLEGCLKDEKCWKLIEQGYNEILPLKLKEIEGAPPGTFWDRTLTFTLGRADKQGHFLQVFCLDPERGKLPCNDKRDILERRVMTIALLKALPLEEPPRALWDERTFKVTGLGERYFDKAKALRPGLLTRLAELTLKALRR